MQLGVLGGGQLARMLALAAHPLGIGCTCLDPAADACVGPVSDLIVGAYDDPAGLDALAAASDVVTFEFESVPASSADRLASAVAVHPPPAALAVAQDRLHEKSLFRELGIDTPDFRRIDSQADLDALELPAVVKTRRLGYDGKGQLVAHERADIGGAFASLGNVPLIAEQLVPFDRELSVIAVRGIAGGVRTYPVVENHHREGILRLTLAPAPDLTTQAQELAAGYMRLLLERLEYVGVLALELFAAGDRLLANEIAPRVHNSGHWTIEGARTSQFENHVRAVADLPLGACDAIGRSAMVNMIGETPPAAQVLAVDGAHLHLYGKAPRPGRKLGHVTVTGRDDLDAAVAELGIA